MPARKQLGERIFHGIDRSSCEPKSVPGSSLVCFVYKSNVPFDMILAVS